MSNVFNFGRLIGEIKYEVPDDHEDTIRNWLISTESFKNLNDKIVAIESDIIEKADISYVDDIISRIPNGINGKSTYELAMENGFIGTKEQWLDSLRGKDGRNGLSAYEVAVKNGFVGTESDWLLSLKGDKGDSVIIEDGEKDTRDASVDSYRIQWLTQAEFSDLQFNNKLNPKVEYHITDRPTTYSLNIVGNELQMTFNGYLVATCDITNLINN